MSTIFIHPDHKLSLQSPNLALIAAGSTGIDGSMPGIHLRWTFGGTLAKKHLPKGEYASYASDNNFNKPHDFVRIYKVFYKEVPVALDFSNVAPNQIFHNEARWLYNLNGKYVYVKFIDKGKYNSVLNTVNPLVSPYSFMLQYNDAPVEVECVNELFFSVTLLSVDSNNLSLRTETYSSKRGYMGNDLYTNSRRTYNEYDFPVRIPCENGRGIRYQGSVITTIIFEFYMDFIHHTNKNNAWRIVGDYALSLEDPEVFERLEPIRPGSIDNKWPRFVNGARVNIFNYMDKWNGDLYSYNDDSGQNIRNTVKHYITLSEDPNNPSGLFNIPLTEGACDESDVMPVSLVALLNAGARDFHVARMLGLGTMDFDVSPYDHFVYMAEYFTYGNLPEYPSSTSVQHLSMSLPVSTTDERLPLPVSIAEIVPGMANDPSPDSSVAALTDANGYTFDGRSRFVTLTAEPLPDNQFKEPFYNTNTEFNLSECTLPVFAGLQYKGPSDGNWVKPELSHDTFYRNPMDDEGIVYDETIPVTVDDVTNVIFLHCQKVSGIHTYKFYGINLFSRVCESGNFLSIDTNILPANFIKPPVNINALLVREENPLLLTSQLDQSRLAAITATDPTLVRLSFNCDNEIVIDKVEEEYDGYNNSALESANSNIYPSSQDTYADEIEIYFRNSIPKNVSGKVVSVTDDTVNPLISIITTGSYTLSNGETLLPSISATDVAKFIGGIFILGNQQFVIQSITPSLTSPLIKVLKTKVNPNTSQEETITGEDHLQAPQLSTSDFLFMIIENMQNLANWGTAHWLKIQIPSWSIKREIFYRTNPDGISERYLEKSRGFWKNANIEAINQPVSEDANGNLVYDYKGLYKITFPGFHLLQPVTGEDNHLHSQYNPNGISVEWYNGIVRLKRKPAYGQTGERNTFEVIRMDDQATGLAVYIQDPDFNGINHANAIKTGSSLQVNYYPGYKLYLYANEDMNLVSNAVLPEKNEGVRYSIFGLRTHDFTCNYYSKMSPPILMFAQEISQPQIPEKPLGSMYATRPDFFGKASYSFITTFKHIPDNVLFARSNDLLLLNALYSEATIQNIQSQLENLGGYHEVFLSNRWQNFFNFNQLRTDNQYGYYPPENGFAFPFPDGANFIDFINDFIRGYYNEPRNMKEIILREAFQNTPAGSLSPNLIAMLQKEYAGGNPILKSDIPKDILDTITSMTERDIENFLNNLNNTIEGYRKVLPSSFNSPLIVSGNSTLYDMTDLVQQAVSSAFVPLTEFPVPYRYIKSGDYSPQPKKQNIKDGAGYLLKTTDPAFDPAPMAKIVNNDAPAVLFTDFTLDGTTNNIYFYAVLEIGTQMQMGEFSSILGPVKSVNTKPPEAPAIKSIIPISGNDILGIIPSVRFEINAYPTIENIRQITIYRTLSPLDAQSIRTMSKVKDVDVNDAIPVDNSNGNHIWTFNDDFSDLTEIPYGQLYYRITVGREVKYAEGKDENNEDIIRTEYAPSLPSKILATLMIESTPPYSPTLNFSSGGLSNRGMISNVILFWSKTTYNGKYYLYKMNTQGNWTQIAEVSSNSETIYLPLADTSLQSDALLVRDEQNNPVYHHFKVIAENTSGLFSSEENILTISVPDLFVYNLTLNTPLNGTLNATVDGYPFVNPISEGTSVTIEAIPDANYKITELNVNGISIPIADETMPQIYTFNMESETEVSANFAEMPNPYDIWTLSDLINFIDEIKAGDTKAGEIYQIKDDIDISSIVSWNSASNYAFEGTLLGNGKIISNLKSGNGLIHVVGESGIVDGVVLINAIIQCTSFAAGLVCYNSGTIRNCYADVKIDRIGGSGSFNLAAIAAYNVGTVKDCFANIISPYSGNVSDRVGGIAGISTNANSIVERCYVTGSLLHNTRSFIAGILGQQNNGIVKNSVSLLSALGGNSCGRIWDYNGSGVNNYALDSMLVNGVTLNTGTLSNKNGQNRRIAQLQVQSFWEGLGFDFTSVWKMSDINGIYKGYPIFQWMTDVI